MPLAFVAESERDKVSQEKRRHYSRPKTPLESKGGPDRSALSKRVHRLLEGVGWEQYGSRYKAFMALVTGLVAANWTDEQIFRELSNPSKCGAAAILREKYQGSLLSQIRSKIGIARSKVKKHRSEIDNWLSQVIRVLPRSRSASLARTATALAVIARGSGSRTFSASVRQIAEVAGLGMATHKGADTKTARKALKMLSELGFVSRRIRISDNEFEPKEMTELTLNNIDTLRYPTNPSGSPWNSEVDKCGGYIVGKCSYEEILHPLWEHSGLGFNSFRVWNLLRSRGELTVREIADLLGMSRSQVRNVLSRRLEEYGLAFRADESRWGFIPRNLDDVAESLGVLDRPDLRKRSFEIQRQNRKQALRNIKSHRPARPVATSMEIDFTTGEMIENDVECSPDVYGLFPELLETSRQSHGPEPLI